MVTALTVTMIAGFITIVVLFVSRFQDLASPGSVSLPGTIDLPANSDAVAFTQGRSWYAVVTDDDEILVFDRQDGRLIQTITIAGHDSPVEGGQE